MRGEEEWPGSCRLSCGTCKVLPHIAKKAFNKKQARAHDQRGSPWGTERTMAQGLIGPRHPAACVQEAPSQHAK